MKLNDDFFSPDWAIETTEFCPISNENINKNMSYFKDGYWQPVLSDDDLAYFEREQKEREVNDLLTDGYIKEAKELENEL